MSRFKPGQSGNPKGKPRGTKHASTKLRDVIAADLPSIVGTLVSRAKDGDVQAASVLLSRCLPALKPESCTPDRPLSGTSLSERAEAIAAASLAGELAPSTAAELMSVLMQQARISEIGELTERIARIEAALQLSEKSK